MAKKIIKGKKYDTETAEKIARYSNEYPQSDFNFMCEELYRKKTGEFFLYGVGGASTQYSVADEGGGYRGGEDLIPLTTEDAKAWAENSIDADDYKKIFGSEDED